MSKVGRFPAQHDSAVKALIIYDDFASALRSNVALQHSTQNVDFAVRWIVSPWRIDVLQFPSAAEEALTDALDAHLIVIAGRSAQSLSFWLQGWLEHWAKCRQIKGAALALFGVGYSDVLRAPGMLEFSSVAKQHDLRLIFDDNRNGKDQSKTAEHFLDERRLLSSATVQPILNAQIQHPHSCWGINE